jgi:hypothetical protein
MMATFLKGKRIMMAGPNHFISVLQSVLLSKEADRLARQ